MILSSISSSKSVSRICQRCPVRTISFFKNRSLEQSTTTTRLPFSGRKIQLTIVALLVRHGRFLHITESLPFFDFHFRYFAHIITGSHIQIIYIFFLLTRSARLPTLGRHWVPYRSLSSITQSSSLCTLLS